MKPLREGGRRKETEKMGRYEADAFMCAGKMATESHNEGNV